MWVSQTYGSNKLIWKNVVMKKIALLLLLACCNQLLARGGVPTAAMLAKNSHQMSLPEMFWNLVQRQDYAGLHQLSSRTEASQAELTAIRQSLLAREEHTEQAYHLLRKLLRSGNDNFVIQLVTDELVVEVVNFSEHIVKLINKVSTRQDINTLDDKLMGKTQQYLDQLNLAYENFEYLYLNVTNGNQRLGKLLRQKVDYQSQAISSDLKKVLTPATETFSDFVVAINSLLKDLVRGSSGNNKTLSKLVDEIDRLVWDVSLSHLWGRRLLRYQPNSENVSKHKALTDALLATAHDVPAIDKRSASPIPIPKQPDFLLNLNQQSKDGNLIPVIGREKELAETFEVLGQRLKSNPILIGDAGVGKTAVVEGLAQKIVANDVPAMFRDKIIYAVDIGLLLQGNIFVGVIEAKVMQMLEFIKHDSRNIVFIDEFHRLMGTKFGQGVAELLKPALSRGEICCIAATTTGEYQKHILEDPAMARRFQAVTVDEPSPEDAIEIIYGLSATFSDYHGITIAREALDASVNLTQQFLPDRKLPDKAIEVIDRASSALKIAGNTTELRREHIAKVIADRTDIPIERILQDKVDKITNLLARLQTKIVGQDQALLTITESLTASYMGLTEKNRPIAIFMLAGPTGVGKTETAKVLSEELFDSGKHFFRLDMSEYNTRFTVSKLIGSPPGYINSTDGGILTNHVQATPHSLVLFDEIEKAHGEVYPLLLQVLEDGRLTDGRGNTVDFSNTVVMFTTNADNLNDHFSSEFLGRIDNVIHYQPLTANHMHLIVQKQVDMLNDNLQNKGIELTISNSAIDALIKRGFDKQSGARSLRTTFKRLVSFQLAQKMGANLLSPGQYQLDFSTTNGWQLKSADGSVISLGKSSNQPKKPSNRGNGYF